MKPYSNQLSLEARAKSDEELLRNATLVCYYPFDDNSYYDFEPLGLNESGIGLSSTFTSEYVNETITFASINAYFMSEGLTLLRISNRSYSMSLWI
jgi:hypothetical protein